jgi:uncharacterized membrane protein YkvI
MTGPAFREAITDAVRFWERGRLAYNLLLAAVVGAVFAAEWPSSRATLTADVAQQLFVLAVVANALYCAAYVVDVVVQFSDFRTPWRRHRWLLLTLGCLFAAVLAQFAARALFGLQPE